MSTTHHPNHRLPNGRPWAWELDDDDFLALGIVIRKTDKVVGTKVVVREGVTHGQAVMAAWAMGACNIGGSQHCPRRVPFIAADHVDAETVAWVAEQKALRAAELAGVAA